MSPEQIEALSQLPLIGILIFLLYRESAAKEKLLTMLIKITQEHARDLLALACGKKPED